MALNRGTFVRNVGTVGTTPIEARLAQAAQWAENAPGTPRSGVVWGAAANLVVGNGSTMSYDISPFQVVINRAANEGVYVMTMTGATNLATTAAPGSGSRFDLIYVKQNDPDKGDADNAPVLGVVQGTSSTGTPTKPYGSVPAGAFVLAEAQIFSGTTFASGGSNTMAQVFAWTATRGAILPIRDLTDRATITGPQIGLRIRRLDRDNFVQAYTGTTTPASGYEWENNPKRYYADSSTFVTTADNVSRLIGSVTTAPTLPYATKWRVRGGLSISCGSIAAGVMALAVAVSVNTAQVTSAQAKTRLSFTEPGAYHMGATAEFANWAAVPANNTPYVRIWVEQISSAVNYAVTTQANLYNFLYGEYLPAED